MASLYLTVSLIVGALWCFVLLKDKRFTVMFAIFALLAQFLPLEPAYVPDQPPEERQLSDVKLPVPFPPNPLTGV